ncbi:hypothetical protein EDF54_2187 [Rathayibacter sp. PhB93]|uniref:hypothetical protein n=1 Tax=unclassified Rathayibacter TaxID=2609250 RepID=UPI000F48E52B|nr:MULTISPECIES: hypothetical protein [unclassified Rathayibacter]ROQ05567.1 hypothetical protein EDF54_2187 [Rathayibacter sp. PhB93]TDQ12362.1 hypothetical protein EDF17_2220 [Rathayibacter sp. PhB1]
MITDAELREALSPVFEEMLSEHEFASLRLFFTRLFIDGTERPLNGGERLDDGDVRVHWEILGEEGWARGLQQGVDLAEFALAVRSDLQDFIAESSFGWGQLRGPRPLR